MSWKESPSLDLTLATHLSPSSRGVCTPGKRLLERTTPHSQKEADAMSKVPVICEGKTRGIPARGNCPKKVAAFSQEDRRKARENFRH